MRSLLIPESQPQFPHEDVSPTNAAIFRQLLCDPLFIDAAHELAEQNAMVFKVGHQTLTSLSNELAMSPTQRNSISYGATIYETLSVVVRGAPVVAEKPIAIKKKLESVMDLALDRFDAAMTMRNHEERLLDEAPLTVQLVDEAVVFRPVLDKRFVRIGAALERDIDIDTMAA